MTPRLWTPPIRELTPDTSYGFDLVDFARNVVGIPLDPWQEWVAIHIGELLADGRPRFRVVLVLVARQNGKTLLCRVLTLYWMFVEHAPMILGTSTSRDYAKRSWRAVIKMAEGNEWLAAELPPKYVRETIGEESFKAQGQGDAGEPAWDSEYIFSAANRRAGRSLTIDKALLDELREHKDFSAWGAAYNAMNAVHDAQLVAISNQGDDSAVVLDSLRTPAVNYIETGEGDPRLGLFEYSSPDGSDPLDLAALAAANPNLGRRIGADVLIGAGMKAKAAGGEELATHKTEVMCMRVALLDPAIDPTAWAGGGTDTPVGLAEHRNRVALCFDVALDGSHASLVAAAVVDGRARAEVVEQWRGFGCTAQLRGDLPALVRKIRPARLGWFPNGPAAAVAADLVENTRPGVRWPPRGVTIEALSAETPAVCMGLAEYVLAGELEHPRDAMLDVHVASGQRHWQGDRWVYVRRGAGPIDGLYALAGAVHLARTMPPPRPELTVA